MALNQMKVKGAKALAARMRLATVADRPVENDLSFDPFDQLTNAIVEMSQNGEFDFLDPLHARKSPAEFETLFAQQMKIEFGKENGEFLVQRYNAGKVSPRMSKQIEAIREYAAGAYRRQCLGSDSVVLNTVAKLYRQAYEQGGLPQVDQAIATVNEKLRLSGSRYGFGPGTACMEGDNGTTEWIAVIFSDLDRDEFVCLEWCHLQYHPTL